MAAEESVRFLRDASRHRPVIAVGGSRGAVDAAVRSACSTALAGVSRYTVRELAATLSERAMYTQGLTPLHSSAREALLAAIARESSLVYLREVSAFPGFPRALARTLNDLRLNRTPAEQVRTCGRSGPDLATLMERYAAELQRRGLADYALRVELAIASIGNLDPPPALLVLDAGQLSASEADLLQVLEQRSPATLRIAVEPPQQPAHSSFLSASSEALEFVEIARRILHADVPFDRCAVLLRNPGRHLALVEEAFNRAGIPVWFERAVRRPDRNGRGFLALLRCRINDYSVADFCDYLSLATLPREEEQHLADGRWERLLDDAAVISGYNRWSAQLQSAIHQANEEYDRKPSEELARRIGALESLRGFALPLMQRLADLPASATWREWMAILAALAGAALQDTRSIEHAVDALIPVSDLTGVTLDTALRTLEPLVCEWFDESEGTRFGKVFVAPLEDARGMDFDFVVVPGLNEGLFPRTHREDPLLLDAQRTALGLGAGVEERDLLQIALGAGERLLFSWSAVDLATGRERVHSFFAAELLASTGGTAEPASSRIGWSAPQLPEDSIDDAEFDLSSYRHAVVSGESMAWLTSVNSHAVRAIQARQRRWSSDWTEADGLNTDFDLMAAAPLTAYRLGERAWSPTALNQFARCPYRFYLYGILRLRRRERPEPFAGIDPLVRGRIYHRSLERHLAGHDAEPIVDIVEQVAAEEMSRQAPPVPGLWKLEVRKIAADLKTWLNIRESAWQTWHVEHSFDDVTLAGGWKLRGVVDLVERHEDGRTRVVDHKTGKPPSKRRNLTIGGGEVLQPLLYALAVEAEGIASPTSAVLSWGTVRGGFFREEIFLHAGSREAAERVLRTVDDSISQGFLPAAPRREGCHDCEYLDVCGPYEEIRTSLKDKKRTSPLAVIRSRK